MRKNKKRPLFQRCKVILFSVMLVLFSMANSNAALSQSKSKLINVKEKNINLTEFVWKIKKLTGYEFVCDTDDLSKYDSISIDKQGSLEEILDAVLKDTDLTYSLEDDIYIIKKKTPIVEQPIQQEKKELKGTVTDTDGNTLPGVSVVVKGTTTGVATDIDGNYSIQLDNENAVLVFSFVGMLSQEIVYRGQIVKNVTLVLDSEQMAEVVVTGYQTIRAHELTSSVVTLKAEELDFAGVSSVDNLVEGLVPGLMSMNTSGTVGAAPKIRIRGTSTISGKREPVWVVDGIMLEDPVPLSAEELNSMDNVNLIGNAISSINPEDIARIDVLKDASATAIYGVRAANGVIVITTKKGKKGPLKVNYSTNFKYGLRPTYDKAHLMNSTERIQVSQEIQERGLEYPIYPSHVGYEGLLMDLNTKKITFSEFQNGVTQLAKNNTDWMDLLYDNSFSQTHNISLSGGNGQTSYYFSGGYNHSDDTEVNVGLKKYNALMKLSSKINDKLNVNLKLSAYHQKKNYNHSSVSAYGYAYNTSRALPYKENGERVFYKKGGTDNNPLYYNIFNELENGGREMISDGIDISAKLNYSILDGLTFSGTYAFSTTNNNQEEFAKQDSYYAASLRGYEYSTEGLADYILETSYLPFGGVLTNNSTRMSTYTLRNQLLYNKQFKDIHSLNIVAGSEIRSTVYDGKNTEKRGYVPDRGHDFVFIDPTLYPYHQDWLESGADYNITKTLNNVTSFYGAFTYGLMDKYILNFNIRTDGSNKFGQDSNDKFLPVWSVSGKWNVSDEPFFSSKNVDMLALRASYGVQGNVVDSETPNLIVRPNAVDPKVGEYTSNIVSLPNPNLRWEKTTSYNFGLDYSLFKGRVSGSMEYYMKKGTDLVANKSISSVNGTQSLVINGSNMDNYGFEFGLSTVNISNKNFTWTTSLNVSQNRNKIVKSLQSAKVSNPYGDYLNGTLILEGNSTDDFYAYKFDGLNEKGLPKFKDLLIEEGENLTEDEYFKKALKKMGSRVPLLSGGFSNSLKYKNLSLNATFSFKLGAKRRLPSLYKSSGQDLPMPDQNMSSDFVNRWQKLGDENITNIPTLSADLLTVRVNPYGGSTFANYRVGANQWQMYNDSDMRVVSADFLRLRTVTLKYDLPSQLLKSKGIDRLSLSFQAQNLFVIADKKLKGLDPEQVSYSAMPISKSFNLGLSLVF